MSCVRGALMNVPQGLRESALAVLNADLGNSSKGRSLDLRALHGYSRYARVYLRKHPCKPTLEATMRNARAGVAVWRRKADRSIARFSGFGERVWRESPYHRLNDVHFAAASAA